MTYIIVLPCVDIMDHTCIGECPVDYIYGDERTLYIRPDECVDRGACEPVCPVEMIHYEDDLPEEWSVLESANAEFFDDIGSPGGAQHPGPTGSNRPYVTGFPSQGE